MFRLIHGANFTSGTRNRCSCGCNQFQPHLTVAIGTSACGFLRLLGANHKRTNRDNDVRVLISTDTRLMTQHERHGRNAEEVQAQDMFSPRADPSLHP